MPLFMNRIHEISGFPASQDEPVSLQTLVQSRLDAAPGNLATEKIHHQGRDFIVKYRRHGQVRHGRSWLISVGCALLFRCFVHPARLRAGDIAYEARRLAYLQQQGVRVPHVVLQTADYLVLEFCGEDLTRRLQGAPADERAALLLRIFDELARFHLAGDWHGGAQVRNLTLHGGQIYRIDFEEAAGDALPLALMQAYDLLLTLQSVVDHLGLDGMAAKDEGVALLQRYFQQAPSPAVKQALCRLEKVTGLLLWLAFLLRQQAQKHKDIRRALLLAQLLRQFCQPSLVAS